MIEITCGILVAVSIYLLLEAALHRKIFAFVLLSTVINIIVLYSGKLTHKNPVFVGAQSHQPFANPVPQALILTAIVIGFGLLIFLCVLMKTAGEAEL